MAIGYLQHLKHSIYNANAIISGETMENEKKVAAAMAAVYELYQQQRKRRSVFSLWLRLRVKPTPVPSAGAPVRLWGASGRQAQMQMRNLMQMRTFK